MWTCCWTGLRAGTGDPELARPFADPSAGKPADGYFLAFVAPVRGGRGTSVPALGEVEVSTEVVAEVGG